MAKLSNGEPTNTSFHGDIIRTTINNLIETIGTPQCFQNDGTDKVNVEWVCKTDRGELFTIYDYKEYKVLDNDKLYDFHIGTYDKNISNRARRELGF